jgi:MerR family transcriptional regulator, copper efflux regulator
MRITEAASRLGTSPRMLRYRDVLGLLPPVRQAQQDRAHRSFDEDDLAAVAMALDFERRYDVSPAEVSFGMRILTEPRLRAELAELGRRIGRVPPPPVRALEFEKERALRLLSLAPGGLTGGAGGAGGPRVSPGRSRRPWMPGKGPVQGRSSPPSEPRP